MMVAIRWEKQTKGEPARIHGVKIMLLFSRNLFPLVQGTTVITNLSSVLKDEAFWEKPNEFYPEHFLDANRQFVKPEAFLPFSAGKSERRIQLEAGGIAGGVICSSCHDSTAV